MPLPWSLLRSLDAVWKTLHTAACQMQFSLIIYSRMRFNSFSQCSHRIAVHGYESEPKRLVIVSSFVLTYDGTTTRCRPCIYSVHVSRLFYNGLSRFHYSEVCMCAYSPLLSSIQLRSQRPPRVAVSNDDHSPARGLRKRTGRVLGAPRVAHATG